MDMHSLIHHQPPSAASDSLPRAPAAFPSAALPGLRAHFPSMPIRLPMIRPASPPDRVMPSFSNTSNNSNSSSMTQDHRRPQQAPVAAASTTLAPLRFIIPSSHCSNSSMNHAYSSSTSSDSVSFRSVAIKAEPEQEPQSSSQTYAQVSAAVAPVDAPQTQMSHFKKEETTQFERSHKMGSDAVFSNDADDDLKTKDKKTAPKRARAIKSSNRSTKSKARPGLRKGKWTDEESRYATQLTNCFKEGLLPIERGTMLRLYLSQKLNCEPMRITKKFTGGECIGKQVFRPCSPTPESRVRLVQAQLELVALEAAFIKKLKENREEAPGSMDDNDSGSSTENDPATQRQASSKKRTNGSSSDDDEGFTSDSSASSSPLFPGSKASAGTGEDDADNANAVGLLLDFFYKANRNEKSDGASKCSSSVLMPPAESAASQSFESDSIANSPTKRIRALSISNYVNDDSLAKRSRVGSFTTVFAK